MNVRIEPEVWIDAFSKRGPSAELIVHLLGSRHRLFSDRLEEDRIAEALECPEVVRFLRRHTWPAIMMEPCMIVAARARKGAMPPVISPSDFYAFELKR